MSFFSGSDFNTKGFAVADNLYSSKETDEIVRVLDNVNATTANFRQSAELFAIRNFLNEVPEVRPLIFTSRLKELVNGIGEKYQPVKSIYFDKPAHSNWFVAYHQDLTISVNTKIENLAFSFWQEKNNAWSVRPPVEILQNIFTLRIHLDETDENNGALYVVSGSHHAGIQRVEETDTSVAEVCRVKRGGGMLMKPLLFHSSRRTINNQRRRVIHIEFSNVSLPDGMHWAEG